ncbi:hypothetical protein L1987_33056 [Smallanthus sonchifolius]|uniref:Uncharacterized protein n=1 Tax=Smallanthus sonchifolius TaxID=185202 RepID=A0ACB9HR68_9ASTR|nr:hypothetical protein L1987_33056 [Smallanthus sonchifolius]
MYTIERMELVKKFVAKRAKEEEIKRKEDVVTERKSKEDAEKRRKGEEKVTGDEEEKRKRDSRVHGERLGDAPGEDLEEGGEEENEEEEEEKVEEEEDEEKDGGDVAGDGDGDGAGDGDGDGAGNSAGDGDDGDDSTGGGGSGLAESEDEESETDYDNDQPPPEYEKDTSDDKIEYEAADGKKVKAEFYVGRSKWFKLIEPTPEQLVQNIKVKKTEVTSKIISWKYEPVKELFVVKHHGALAMRKEAMEEMEKDKPSKD